MNWEAIGAIGEIVGAIAVVGSLLYLGTQVRIQNRESRATSVHEITEAYRHTLSALHDVDNAELWVKAVKDFDGLTESERMRFVALFLNIIKTFEEAYYQLQADRFDAHFWEGMLAQFGDLMSAPGAKQVWGLRKHQFGRDFREFMDSLEQGEYKL